MGIGIDRTIESVLLPVLREVGTRWESGTCDVANEHFASQEIRRWLSAQLALVGSRGKKRSAVLACGPKDVHTIGLEGFYDDPPRTRLELSLPGRGHAHLLSPRDH